jgi:DNA-directed RNA polymerase specialized sigma24 family protein
MRIAEPANKPTKISTPVLLPYCRDVEFMNPQITEIQGLIQACVGGDAAARRQFQDVYGEDIYNFPVKIHGLQLEEAGNFYVYVFEDDRIFNRLRTFEGRQGIQFRTFLSYYVLKHLFLEWRRTYKELDTISLQTPLGSDDDSDRTLEDVLPANRNAQVEEESETTVTASVGIWETLSPEERLDVKLLSLLECDLGPDDIRLLAELSRRSIIDTLNAVAEVQEGLKRKDQKLTQLRDELDSTWGWIVFREKELQEIRKKLHHIERQSDAVGRAALVLQYEEIERALAKRHRQRERILAEIRSYKMTTPYKDIARLLNLTVGTVCSRVFRLRVRLAREFGQGEAFEEAQP